MYARPPAGAVYYRDFANTSSEGHWGEYEHREDAAWQEYVLRCWDEEKRAWGGGRSSETDDEALPFQEAEVLVLVWVWVCICVSVSLSHSLSVCVSVCVCLCVCV